MAQQSTPPVLVRRYRDERAYEREAQQLAQQGYKVVSVLQQPRKWKAYEIGLTWGLVLLNWRLTDYVVTYSR